MYLPANENEVAAVADDHRVVVQDLEQLAVDPGRVHRIGVARQQRPVGGQSRLDRLGQARNPFRVRLPGPNAGAGASRRTGGRQRGEERGQVTRGRGGQRDVPGDPLRRVGHVHHPGRRVLRAERAVPEPEVQRRPRHDDQVGLAQRRRPGPGHQQLVTARKHPSGLAVDDYRQAQFLRGPPGRVLGAAQPHVGAQHQYRPPGRTEQAGDPVHVPFIRRDRRHRALGRQVRLGLTVERLERDVQEHRPAVRARRQPEGLVHRPGQPRRVVLGPGSLGYRREQRRMIHLLQAARAPAIVGSTPGQHDHRGAVEPCGGHRADRVRHARSGRDHGQPGCPGQSRGRLRREHRGLLVPHVHQAHRRACAVLDHRVVEREHMPAGQRKHHRYAVPPGGRHRVRAAMPR